MERKVEKDTAHVGCLHLTSLSAADCLQVKKHTALIWSKDQPAFKDHPVCVYRQSRHVTPWMLSFFIIKVSVYSMTYAFVISLFGLYSLID